MKPCNAVLYDCIHKDDGTTEYTPKHIYCYKPLSKSLDAILARPGGSTSAINGEQERPLPVSIQTFMTVLCGKDLFVMVFYVNKLAWHCN